MAEGGAFSETAIEHGGSLRRAAARYPDAPRPWLDLSTGINPHAYPMPALAHDVFARLPEPARAEQLAAVAARACGALAGANLAPAPGTQILLPLVTSLVPPGRAAVLSPTYAEHARAARIAGHDVAEVESFKRLFDADLAVLVNPNNPDGRVVARRELLRLAGHLAGRGGLLVVDEAFMDVGPSDESLCGDVEADGIVVLRSFGKFFGLAGLRLGFAVASAAVAGRLRNRLGPWAVSGPALEVGLAGLADLDWQAAMRSRLGDEAARLDALLARFGLEVSGGTCLFRFLRTPDAAGIADALGRRGILVRTFDHDAEVLRIGMPGGDAAFERLAAALSDWHDAIRARP